MKTVRLRADRGKSLKGRHPWIFSGALAARPDGAEPGETVLVTDIAGKGLAVGAWSPASQIAVRIWSFDPAEIIDADWFRARLAAALELRRQLPGRLAGDACRLVNAESDGLPGLIVDRYADFIVCQFLSAGAERWKDTITDVLQALCGPRGIYERSDTDAREKEGLAPASGLLRGDAPPQHVEISLAGRRFLVDPVQGHKTGFYLDQAENLAVIAQCAADREVLNGFAYTGAFTVMAACAGAARVVSVESSGEAVSLNPRHLELNGCDAGKVDAIQGDLFTELRRFRDARREFDLVILDPPKFVANAAQVQKGARAYKDANLLAMKLLRPGGVLITFSCSGHVHPELFQKIVADAALDARRTARIVRWLSQSGDHPVSSAFPEGRYLKGLVCRVDPDRP